jgi:hypothetical protein
MQKKYQVFISSTYTDLIEERQQAVLAVLKANHIPAGMELFKAGSLDQLQTIERWIDESDIYMLILGGRYGTLEPKSKKSYTHLEFEYALKSKIPIFVIQLTDNMLKIKSLGPSLKDADVYEQKNKNKYKDFKSLVAGHNRVVAYVDNTDQIKSEVLGSINEIIHLNDLKGWVREDSNQANEELERALIETYSENKRLLTRIEELEQFVSPLKIGQFTPYEILHALTNNYVPLNDLEMDQQDTIQESQNFLNLLLNNEFRLLNGIPVGSTDELSLLLLKHLIPVLRSLDMVEIKAMDSVVKLGPFRFKQWVLNENGRTFVGKIQVGAIDISGYL